MFEARIQPASVFKRLVEALKDLVSDANWECSEEGLTMQAMDSSHIALVIVRLDRSGFAKYRCDRPIPLGVNIESLKKVLKAAKDSDILKMKATEHADLLNLVFEANNSDRIQEYNMKLMNIDYENLGIPETDYDAQITMASADFSRICKDMIILGDNMQVEVSKGCVVFSLEGDMMNGRVSLRQSEGARIKFGGWARKQHKKKRDWRDRCVNGEKEQASGNASDDDYVMASAESEESEEETGKRTKGSKTNPRTNKTGKKKNEEADGVLINLNRSVISTFSLKFLLHFSKSASLVETVVLSLSNDSPLMISYDFGQGQISFYLAPKVGDD